MPVLAIAIYLMMPAISYMGIEKALSFKGCLAPGAVCRICKAFIICDFLIKIALLPLFHDADDYVVTAMVLSMLLLGIILVPLYLKLKKQNLRTIKKFPSNENFTLLGLGISAWLVASLIVESVVLYSAWRWSDPSEVKAIMCIVVFFCLMCIAFIFMQLSRLDRIKVPAMRSLRSLESNNPPIVLLRSFELDKYPWWNNKTFDEELCGNIDVNRCPIVSLSDPDQILPTGGSLKIQSKDDYWKTVVDELLKSCRALVIVEGDSEGLSWEIERIRSIYGRHPDKVFFYIPSNRYRTLAWCVDGSAGNGLSRNLMALLLKWTSPLDTRKRLKACWTGFSSFISGKGFRVPQTFPGDNRVIAFDSSGNPTVLPKRNGAAIFNEILRRTEAYRTATYDYPDLARKIEAYEVNGFMSPSQIKEYEDMSRRLARRVYRIAGVLLALSLLIWIIN